MSSDIVTYQISPFLTPFDLFKIRNTSREFYMIFKEIGDEYLQSEDAVRDIVSYDDTELLQYLMNYRGISDPRYIIELRPSLGENILRYISSRIPREELREEFYFINIATRDPWFFKEYVIRDIDDLSDDFLDDIFGYLVYNQLPDYILEIVGLLPPHQKERVSRIILKYISEYISELREDLNDPYTFSGRSAKEDIDNHRSSIVTMENLYQDIENQL